MKPTRGRPATFQRRVLGVLLQHHMGAGWDAAMPRVELLARLRVGQAGQMTQKHLSRALVALYGRGLVRLGNRRRPLASAADLIREMEADLQLPEAAYARYLTAGLRGSYDQFLARRRGTLASWRAGRGRPCFPVQLVALTPEGRAAAEAAANNGDFSPHAESPQKSGSH